LPNRLNISSAYMRYHIFVSRFSFCQISLYNTFPYIGVKMYIIFVKYLKPIIMRSRSKLLKRMNSVIKDNKINKKKLSSQTINLASEKDILYHISNPPPVGLISSSQEKKLLHDNIILDISQSFY